MFSRHRTSSKTSGAIALLASRGAVVPPLLHIAQSALLGMLRIPEQQSREGEQEEKARVQNPPTRRPFYVGSRVLGRRLRGTCWLDDDWLAIRSCGNCDGGREFLMHCCLCGC